MPNELEVGLQRQTALHFVLVHRGKNSLRGSHWPCRPVQGPKIAIQSLGPRRYVRVGDGHAELVVRPGILKSDEFKPGIGIVVDQILVRRRIRGARKDANSSIDVVADPQKLLLEDRVDAVVPGDSGWRSRARRGWRARGP